MRADAQYALSSKCRPVSTSTPGCKLQAVGHAVHPTHELLTEGNVLCNLERQTSECMAFQPDAGVLLCILQNHSQVTGNLRHRSQPISMLVIKGCKFTADMQCTFMSPGLCFLFVASDEETAMHSLVHIGNMRRAEPGSLLLAAAGLECKEDARYRLPCLISIMQLLQDAFDAAKQLICNYRRHNALVPCPRLKQHLITGQQRCSKAQNWGM